MYRVIKICRTVKTGRRVTIASLGDTSKVFARCFYHSEGNSDSNSFTADKTTELPRNMKAWCINRHGSNDMLELRTLNTPALRAQTDVIVRVNAASINPIDLRMREGYGSKLLNIRRQAEKIEEFPLILGRDFSGVVVKAGRLVKRFRVGDEVWGTPAVTKQGTHAEFVVAGQDEIALKPASLSHVEASSIPYVACTTWVGLVSRAGINTHSAKGKRVFIFGGSGGIGTFSVQLMKAWGAHVTSSCSTDAVTLVESLGADCVVDYTSADMENELQALGRFDVILDPFGGENEKLASSLLSRWNSSVYVSLAPPLLPRTDKMGVGWGILSSGQSLLTSSVRKGLCSGSATAWGFFSPNPGALDHVTQLVQLGKIKPIVQKVFPFSQMKDAYGYLENGHARGKTVVQMSCLT